MSVRVRYAPSPTGDPHVGNIRTAIWTWLHARRHGGAFILRIEDTDQSRAVEGSVGRIEDSLRWLGLEWDEGPGAGGDYGPYVQSQRLERYHAASEALLRDGHAYRCFCTPTTCARCASASAPPAGRRATRAPAATSTPPGPPSAPPAASRT